MRSGRRTFIPHQTLHITKKKIDIQMSVRLANVSHRPSFDKKLYISDMDMLSLSPFLHCIPGLPASEFSITIVVNPLTSVGHQLHTSHPRTEPPPQPAWSITQQLPVAVPVFGSVPFCAAFWELARWRASCCAHSGKICRGTIWKSNSGSSRLARPAP